MLPGLLNLMSLHSRLPPYSGFFIKEPLTQGMFQLACHFKSLPFTEG